MTTTGQPAPRPHPYAPPGPGVWTRDTDHQSSPRGLLVQEIVEAGTTRGSHTSFARYGLPVDRLEARHVNGWNYTRVVPAGVPDRGGSLPPRPLLWIATRVSPELRRRRRTAAAAIEKRSWRNDADSWAGERQTWVEQIETLLAEDLVGKSNASLADHIDRALSVSKNMFVRHFELLGLALGVGRLLTAATEWGLETEALIAELRGSSPSSAATRAPLAELAEIAAEEGPVPGTVSGLRALSPRAAELVDDYLRVYGWRPLGADLEARCLAERPDQLTELVRAATASSTRSTSMPAARGPTPVDTSALVRARVPAGARVEFDTLMADARACYASLDDNAGVASWALGTLKRAVLEVARRAAASGAIEEHDDVFNLTSDELRSLAAGDHPVGLAELTSRRRARGAATQPPETLGSPPQPLPDPSVFPPPIAALTEALFAYLGRKFSTFASASSPPRSEQTSGLSVRGHQTITGIAAVAGTVTGRVVVSSDPADALGRVEPGDILVCPYTTAAYNALFPVLGGIATEHGGLLGHTAVMAREFAIPAMVGTGALPLELDGLEGTLTVARA